MLGDRITLNTVMQAHTGTRIYTGLNAIGIQITVLAVLMGFELAKFDINPFLNVLIRLMPCKIAHGFVNAV